MTALCEIEKIGQIGKYSLMKKLAEGSLGSVYKAIPPDSDRAVAIRILKGEIKGRPPNATLTGIAPILEIGHENGSSYIVTEWIEGSSLRTIIDCKMEMTVEKKVAIMIQVAEILRHAHEIGLLHGDLRPAKIHLTGDTVRIRDLGFAQMIGKPAPPGARWGSAIYLSPEQIQHQHRDARSEIFSAGLVFYELLTWRHPFHDPNSNIEMDRILLEKILPSFEEYPEAPPGIWAILNRCLAKDPKDRYQTMFELSGALDDLRKDIARESQLMLSELLGALPRLRIAAGLPESAGSLVSFQNEIEELVTGRHRRDYVALDRLMAGLVEHYDSIRRLWEVSQGLQSNSDPPVAPEDPQPAGRAFEASGEDTEILQAPKESALPVEVEKPAEDSPSQQETPAPKAEIQEVPKPDTREMVVAAAQSNEVKTTVYRRLDKYNQYRRRAPRAFGTAAALLALLLMVTAVYIYISITSGKSRQAAAVAIPLAERLAPVQEEKAAGPEETVHTLLGEATALFTQHRLEESRVFLNRILELDPSSKPAADMMKQIEAETALSAKADAQVDLGKEPERILGLIKSGQLRSAKSALDRLRRINPTSPDLPALRRNWEAASAKFAAETQLKEEEQKTLARRQKEEQRAKHVGVLYQNGRYDEARGALVLWTAEDPESAQAREMSDRIEKIQRAFRDYDQALVQARYQDALTALDIVRQINPGDPNLTRMRSQVDSKKMSARATLTVRRLGEKAILLLDGKPAGSEGEMENESIPIGSHTLTVVDRQNVAFSRALELHEGQKTNLVYNTATQQLRPMADGDSESLARRRSIEEVHRIPVEHSHGLLRGSCKGILRVSGREVVFEPSGGAHGFRISFDQANLRISGRILELSQVADGKDLQSYRALDPQEAEIFKQAWDQLKSLARQ